MAKFNNKKDGLVQMPDWKRAVSYNVLQLYAVALAEC